MELTKIFELAFFQKFQKSVYCDETESSQFKQSLFDADGMTDKCRRYFEDLWKIEQDWAMHFRNTLRTRGHHTNNNCEISVRFLKRV